VHAAPAPRPAVSPSQRPRVTLPPTATDAELRLLAGLLLCAGGLLLLVRRRRAAA
jgi:hypothetical protein